jgi:hypothetical protein
MSVDAAIKQAAEEAAAALIEHLENRVRFLESRLDALTRPLEILTLYETAALIRVHSQTLRDWNKEKPPRIPFIEYEGGDKRYRRTDIDNYLKSRERGKASRLAA